MLLIPLPQKITASEGRFSIDHHTAIVLDAPHDDFAIETAKFLQDEIQKIIAIRLPIKIMPLQNSRCVQNCIYFEHDPAQTGNEAYQISVTSERITIGAFSSHDFIYAVGTLVQLCKQSGGEIDGVQIIDHPAYSNRGYLLDVSRGRVPSMQSLKALVDKLALYKINQLQLYMENSLRIDGFEEIWSQTDPFTPEEILELDRHCMIRGIELVPSIAAFGHLYDLLRSVSFRKYREIDSEQAAVFTWPNRMRHYTINVSDPGSLTLIKEILDQYLPLFRSSKVNICCDETFDLGKGKSASLAASMNYGDLYYYFVEPLIEYLQSQGKEVMIWGDVLHNHPDLIDKLKTKVTCLNWYYECGVKDETVKIFSEKGMKQYVCPSTAGYSRLVNAYDHSFANIRQMALLGKEFNAEGFLNTDWGDYGGINMPSLSIPCMIYGAAQCWNPRDDREIQTIDPIISFLEFRDHDQELAGILRELSRQDLVAIEDLVYFRDYKIYGQTYENSDLWMHEKAKNKIIALTEQQLKAAIAVCEDLMKRLKMNDCVSQKGFDQEIAEFYLSVRGVALVQGLALIIKQKEYLQEVQPLDTPQEMANKLERWLADYCQAWQMASRESELYRIKEFIQHLSTILRNYGA